MNYAMPLYSCKKDERPGRLSSYSCIVEIGGIRYIGASARTKKEAEIKAARTALLAIESRASHSSETQFGPTKLTVVPCKKRVAESNVKVDETSKVPKAKKPRFKRKPPRKKKSGDKKGRNHIKSAAHVGANIESQPNGNDESCVSVHREVLENGEPMEVRPNDPCMETMKFRPLAACAVKNLDDGMSIGHHDDNGILAGDNSLSLNGNKVCGNGNSIEMPSNESSFQIMESGLWAAEAMKSMDTGMPINYQNEKGLLAEVDSLSHDDTSIFVDKNSTELLSNEPHLQTMESIPEALKNLDDGISLDHQNEKGTLAGEGFLSLDSSNIFENGSSTELQYIESCLPIIDSSTLAAETKGNYVGMPVNDQNEKGSLPEEGSVSFNNINIFENESTNLQNENNLGTADDQIFDLSHGQTREK